MLRVSFSSGLSHCYISLPPSLHFPIGPVSVISASCRRFFSFSGLPSEEGRLSLAPELANCANLQEGEIVSVSPTVLPIFLKIEVDPVDEDSWELIEANSEYFESAILTQINVVEVDRAFPLWIHGAQTVKIRPVHLPQAAGLISDETEVEVCPKMRRELRQRKQVLRNVVGLEPVLELNGGVEGQVLMLKSGVFVRLGVVRNTTFKENHLKSPFFYDFDWVEVEETRLPGFNTPFVLHTMSKKMSLMPTALIRIKITQEEDESSLIQHLKTALGPIILQNNMTFTVENRLFSVEIPIPDQDSIGCIYLDSRLPSFEACLAQIQFEQTQGKPPISTLFSTSEKRKIVYDFQSLIERYFAGKGSSGIFVLSGPSGIGKTSLISMLKNSLKANFIATKVISCRELTLSDEKYLTEIRLFVEEAEKHAPVVVVMDDIDAVIRRVDANAADGSAVEALRQERSINGLISLFETEFRNVHPKVKFLLTCSSLSSLPERLLTTGYCDIRRQLKPPDLQERLEIVKTVFPNSEKTDEIAEAMQSFLPVDIANVIRNAELQGIMEKQPNLEKSVFAVLETFVPRALQGLPEMT